ncbi:unnamed protein product [Chrysoparadoxa australica]
MALVRSEVHLQAADHLQEAEIISRFPFVHPSCQQAKLTLVHRAETSVASVGLQVWPASFLLADYILAHPELFQDKVGLELGAGTGLSGLALSCHSEACYFTDCEQSLNLLARNVEANRHLCRADCRLYVRELDWSKDASECELSACLEDHSVLPSPGVGSLGHEEFAWKSEEIAEMQGLDVILASDVIYDDDLTEMFFDKLLLLMPCPPARSPTLYIALDKRINFDAERKESVATSYDTFLKRLESDFTGSKLSLAFSNSFGMTRSPYLELWEVRRKKAPG